MARRFTAVRAHPTALALGLLVLVTMVTPASSATAVRKPVSIPVVVYHGLTSDSTDYNNPHSKGFYSVRMSDFDAQIQWLHKSGYRTISPQQYVAWVEHKKVSLPAKPIMITFDDGVASAGPATKILASYGFRAVMFVVTGFADNVAGRYGRFYMTWDDLRSLRAEGWYMEFHAGPSGHDYVDTNTGHFYTGRFQGESEPTYRARVRADVAAGLAGMREELGLRASRRPELMAIPWNDENDPWVASYFASLFKVVFTQTYGFTPEEKRRARYEVHSDTTLASFQDALRDPVFGR